HALAYYILYLVESRGYPNKSIRNGFVASKIKSIRNFPGLTFPGWQKRSWGGKANGNGHEDA
ncbi:MAG: hypothetical protein QME66_13815, partial [Candidatus Eisenbacteria bacterium]|nr:hypothetical protein [Candidatus Eisenbacteria bacterium]